MQPMLVSYSSCYFSFLEGDIAEVSKILTSGFQPISPRPAKTSFHVVIEENLDGGSGIHYSLKF